MIRRRTLWVFKSAFRRRTMWPLSSRTTLAASVCLTTTPCLTFALRKSSRILSWLANSKKMSLRESSYKLKTCCSRTCLSLKIYGLLITKRSMDWWWFCLLRSLTSMIWLSDHSNHLSLIAISSQRALSLKTHLMKRFIKWLNTTLLFSKHSSRKTMKRCAPWSPISLQSKIRCSALAN